MTLTDIEKLKLEIGLIGDASSLLSDSEIQYFLDSNKTFKSACLSTAKTVLFILSQYLHEKTASELEIWGNTWYENYKDALRMYVSNPAFNSASLYAAVWAGGLSKSEIENYKNDPDLQRIVIEKGIPTDSFCVDCQNV